MKHEKKVPWNLHEATIDAIYYVWSNFIVIIAGGDTDKKAIKCVTLLQCMKIDVNVKRF